MPVFVLLHAMPRKIQRNGAAAHELKLNDDCMIQHRKAAPAINRTEPPFRKKALYKVTAHMHKYDTRAGRP
jgi:hypothetical protein